jgi:hypothetical protein
VVRCSLGRRQFDSSRQVVGLLDTCLHVSHRASRASTLLQSAATDAMSGWLKSLLEPVGATVLQARQKFSQLAALLNPAAHDDSYCQLSDDLNIALETPRPLQPGSTIVQNDLCSICCSGASQIKVICPLTLRVIFSICPPCGMSKVPLECSCYRYTLRLLDTVRGGAEVWKSTGHAEVALESLLSLSNRRSACRTAATSITIAMWRALICTKP